jgi:hypothetical protein
MFVDTTAPLLRSNALYSGILYGQNGIFVIRDLMYKFAFTPQCCYLDSLVMILADTKKTRNPESSIQERSRPRNEGKTRLLTPNQ